MARYFGATPHVSIMAGLSKPRHFLAALQCMQIVMYVLHRGQSRIAEGITFWDTFQNYNPINILKVIKPNALPLSICPLQ